MRLNECNDHQPENWLDKFIMEVPYMANCVGDADCAEMETVIRILNACV